MPVNAENNLLNIKAPDFNLISVDEKYYSLGDLSGKNGTVIAFICNHCPYVVKIINRLVFEANELNKLNVSTIAIMSNDTSSYPEDSYENMKIFAKKHNFNFPYLYDNSQKIAKKYGAICTPDFFGFNRFNILKYRGRLDSGLMNINKSIKRDLFYAMEHIINTNEGPKTQLNSFGCSIKWNNNE
jgi:peroxiredoxin